MSTPAPQLPPSYYRCPDCYQDGLQYGYHEAAYLVALWKVWPLLSVVHGGLQATGSNYLYHLHRMDTHRHLFQFLAEHSGHNLEVATNTGTNIPLDPATRWQGLVSDASEPFVEELARDATDFVTLAIFADWLEEHGHTKLGERFRKMMPQEGDVLVYTHQLTDPEHFQAIQQCASEVRDRLLENFGLRTCWIVKDADMDLDLLDEDRMHALGWVRAPQFDPPTVPAGGAMPFLEHDPEPDPDDHDDQSPESSPGPAGETPGTS